MALFQALLLAASLGWTSVLAEPFDSGANASTTSVPWSLTHTGIEATLKGLMPHTESSAAHLSAPAYPASGTMTLNSPVTLQSAVSLSKPPVYASPVTMVASQSLEAPGSTPGQHQQIPTTKPEQPDREHQHPYPGEEKTGSTWQSVSPTTTAAGETYYVHGQPLIAGASPTVIAGTTFSVGTSGGRVWVNGKATSASGVVSTPAALAKSSYAPAVATGGAAAIVVPGMVLGLIFGVVGVF